MRLTSLRIDALPGLELPIEIPSFGPGVNVVLGPNASGKSSLVRALLAVLYPDEEAVAGAIDVQAELVASEGSAYRVRRQGGTVTWESGGRPAERPPLPGRHLVRTYVLNLEDLLGPRENDQRGKRRGAASPELAIDEHIAHSLDKQLTGGIDLRAVRKSIGSQAEKGQRLAGVLRDATAALAEQRRQSAALRQQEARLAALRQERAAAASSAGRLRTVKEALNLLQADLELRALHTELAAMPAHLGELLGNEEEELVRALGALDQKRRELKQLDELAAEGRKRLESLGAPVTLSVADAQLHLDLSESYVAAREALSQKQVDIAALRARHDDALRRLGGARSDRAAGAEARLPAVRLDESALERIEHLLQQRQEARAELHEIRRQLEEVSRLVEPADGDALLDVPAGVYQGGRTMDGLAGPLRSIRNDLLRWLREPANEPRRPDWAWGAALGLAVALVGASGLGLSARWLVLLAGLEVAWLAVVWLLLAPASSPIKARIEADVKALQDDTDLPLPAEWTYGSVIETVFDVDDEISRREASEREYQRYDERFRRLTSDSRLAQDRVAQIQAEIDGLRGEIGFGVASDIGLALWLQAAREVEATQRSLHAAQAELRLLEERADELGERLERYLSTSAAHAGPDDATGHRLDPHADPDSVSRGRLDPHAALARCRELVRLAGARRDELAEQERLARERQRVNDEAMAQSAMAEAVLERCQLRDLGAAEAQPAVSRLLAHLPAWRATKERLRAKESLLGELRSRVVHDAELLDAAARHDRRALEEAAAAAEQAALRVDELTRDVHRIERDVERAGADHQLQRAAAAVQLATDELQAHRHEASELAAAEFMLDVVEAEHEAEARPAALQRASEWFSRFTAGAFELTFEAATAGGRKLGALDAGTGRPLPLSELSTGTRAQLLLASRLAFALESEQGGASLPFFLDEALTTSDERRFRQVARAILTVARDDGRQFVYLSARDDDAELWHKAAAELGVGVEVIEGLSAVA